MIETEDLEPILNRVHEWTRAADVKVDILTAIEAGVVALMLPALVTWIQDPRNALENKLWFLLGFGFLLVALMKSIQALFPRTTDQWWKRLWHWGKREHADEIPKSITYFGDIADMTRADYRERLNTITPADLREDWIGQIHLSAGIAGAQTPQYQGRDSPVLHRDDDHRLDVRGLEGDVEHARRKRSRVRNRKIVTGDDHVAQSVKRTRQERREPNGSKRRPHRRRQRHLCN